MHRFGSNKRCVLLPALALVWLCATASADSVYYFTGNVEYGGHQIMNGDRPDLGTVNHTGLGRQMLHDMCLGLDFRVQTYGIVITHLGVWDDAVMNLETGRFDQFLRSPHMLEVWDLATQSLLAQIATQPYTGELHGDYRYFRLDDPLFLPLGAEFSVVVGYYGDNGDSNGNSGRVDQDLEATPTVHDSDGAVIGIGGARFSLTMDFPDILDTGPPDRYHAGSFRYIVLNGPIPEPGTLGLVLLAAGGLVLLRRHRRA